MKNALRVSVLRDSWINQDCTNNGLSSRFNKLLLVGEGVEGHLDTDEEEDFLILKEVKFFKGEGTFLKAIPYSLKDKFGVQFGGNFIYTTDSRFPSEQPIKVYDRVE